MNVLKKITLADKATFGLPATAAEFVELQSREDVAEAVELAAASGRALFVLGGGSNVLFAEPVVDRLVGRMMIGGIEEVGGAEKRESGKAETLVKAGAGVVWDELVAWSVERGLCGIEAMAGIPGTVGAAPVQNIGAYGQELKDSFVELEAFDLREKKFVTLSPAECEFGYRDSVFKKAGAGRYIIVSVTLRLERRAPVANYASLVEELGRRGITTPTVSDIREAVLAVRKSRLADPAMTPNVGSFFTNPIISVEQFEKIKLEYPKVPSFPAEPGMVKVPAGWLIEQAGFKGSELGKVGVFAGNALVLTNLGGASYEDVARAEDLIVKRVFKQFAIKLVREPEVIK